MKLSGRGPPARAEGWNMVWEREGHSHMQGDRNGHPPTPLRATNEEPGA